MGGFIDYEAQPYPAIDVQYDHTSYYVGALLDDAKVYMESNLAYCNVDIAQGYTEDELIKSIKDRISFTYGKNPCIHIKDSYLITDIDDMAKVLEYIHSLDEYQKLQEYGYTRTFESELAEWNGHNELYNLGIRPGQTGSVAIDQKEPLWRRIIYRFLRFFARLRRKS